MDMAPKRSATLRAALLALIPALAPLVRVQERKDQLVYLNAMSSDNRTTTIYLNDPEVAPEQSFGKFISPWHHIPMRPKSDLAIVNVVVEIPQGTRAKYEMNKKRSCNPLVQDVKNGEYRGFSYGEIPYNYGFVPQTWEDPSHQVLYNSTHHSGDNDPLDAFVVSGTRLRPGEVVAARVLGSFPMLDSGEMDHKLLVVNVADPEFGECKSLLELKRKDSKVIRKIVDWLFDYKSPDKNIIIGCEINRRSQCQPVDQDLALSTINETHQHWEALHRGSAPHSKDYGFALATKCDIRSNDAVRALPIFWLLLVIESGGFLWL